MDETTALSSILYQGYVPTLDDTVALWLKEKISRTDSEDTRKSYEPAIAQFRALLQHADTDLDGDPRFISMMAEGWAGHATRKEKIAPTTFNHRLAIISSFYEYAIKHGVLEKNPMKLVDRRPGAAKNYAHPLEQKDVQERLQNIDQRTLSGLRDYALLLLALTTGRRSKELASLRLGDIQITDSKAVVTWQRCKGAKIMFDDLQPRTLTALVTYLGAVYGNFAELPADTPIWLSFAWNDTKGMPIGKAAISDICKKWLGTSKVHATRHTFAIAMEAAGAKLSDIGARLGHNNLSTTSEYMQRLHSHENPFGQKLEEFYGL